MTNSPGRTILRGQTLAFNADPFIVDGPEAYSHTENGMVFLRDGKIEAVGSASELTPRIEEADTVHDHGDKLIMAGFVDTHVHYPQLGIIGSWGTQLIDWLNTYTFPEEARFGDADHARATAKAFVNQCLANGISTASVFCTVHEQSVDALFSETDALGMRMLAGKVLMDRTLAPSQSQSLFHHAPLCPHQHPGATGRRGQLDEAAPDGLHANPYLGKQG